MSLANISIVGNLAREPEQVHFESGRTKTTLVVAVDSFNKVRKEPKTDYYRVDTWDRLAELALQYLKKGNQVAVSGRLSMEKWVDRDGKDRVTPIVQANQLALPPRSGPNPKNPVELVPMDSSYDPGPIRSPAQSQSQPVSSNPTISPEIKPKDSDDESDEEADDDDASDAEAA